MNKGINNPGFRSLPQSVQSKIISRMKYGGNMYAAGGPMDQLTEFTEGGTHEENPIGGIPQGTSPNGQTNLVEQGETKLNKENYIFSDQLKMDAVTVAEFNLPKSFVGKTFAEASKKMDKPNSRRENDTIEMADTERSLAKLKEAQEFHKQQEVQKKIDEIMALDPNALASMMGEAQQAQQGQPPIDPSMMGQGAPEEMGPEEMAMMEQEAMQQQGAATGDAAMMQQMGMMRNGGMMYADGGDMDNYGGPGDGPRFSFQVNPGDTPAKATAEQMQYMSPASAIDTSYGPLSHFETKKEAEEYLLSGNDTSRAYYNNPLTGEVGELIGDNDSYYTTGTDLSGARPARIARENITNMYPQPGENGEVGPYYSQNQDTNFQSAGAGRPYANQFGKPYDWQNYPASGYPYEKQFSKEAPNRFFLDKENEDSILYNLEVDDFKSPYYAKPKANQKDLGGFMKNNTQGILGGLQTAAGIGAMFVPGMQGLGTNLIGGGIGNITGEIKGDQEAEMQNKAIKQQELLAKQQANTLPQQQLDPYGNPMATQGIYNRNGGRMYNVGGYMNSGYANNLPDEDNMINPDDLASTGGFLETRPNTTFGQGGNMYALGGPMNNGFNPNPNTEVIIDPITGLDINAIPNPTPLNITPIAAPKVVNRNPYQNVEIPGVENFNSGTNMIPSSYFQNNKNQPNEEQIELTPDDDDYYKVSEVPNNVLTNPSQLFSDNYSQSILPGSGVYSNESKKKENYADIGDLTDTTMDLSIDQSPLDFGLQVAPIAWNLAKGLQKPMEFKGSQFYTKIDPTLVDYTNAENIAKETGAGVMKGIKNAVPGGGSYASSMLASQQNLNKALAEIGSLEENTNKKLKGDTDKLNITRKDAANMQALQMNLAAQQAKELLLQEALTQGKGMSEQGTANDLAQKYATMSAPDISRFKKVGYSPYYQQVLESIKNKKK